jgi:tetratricopeptide (TPR) repeat protein/DNA-binding transcriptional regulator YiaG
MAVSTYNNVESGSISYEEISPLLNKAIQETERNVSLALELAQSGVVEARNYNDRALEIKGLIIIARCYIHQSLLKQAMVYVDEGIALWNMHLKTESQSHEDIQLYLSLKQAEGDIAYKAGKFEEALDIFEEILFVQKSSGNLNAIIACKLRIGMVFARYGDHDTALKYYLDALKIAEDLNDTERIAECCNNVGNVYFRLKIWKEAESYLQRCLELRIHTNNLKGAALARRNIGNLYMETGDPRKALYYFHIAREIFQQTHTKVAEANTDYSIGVALAKLDHKVYALYWLKTALRITEEIEEKNSISIINFNIAEVLKNTELYEDALIYYTQALEWAERTGDNSVKFQAHRGLAEIYAAQQDYLHAYHHLQILIHQQDETDAREKWAIISKVQASFDNEYLRQQTERERSKRAALESEVENKSGELAALVMQINRNNTYIRELKDELLDNSAGGSESTKLLKTINKFESETIASWEIFLQQFREVHSNFYKTLVKNPKPLTTTEIKICALVKLQLSNKDIATMLGVSIRTVENHRARIRKKFHMPFGSSLCSYLNVL